jgi:hypothetical protein
VSLDVVVRLGRRRTVSFDVVLIRLGRRGTVSLDVVFRLGRRRTVSLDVLLVPGVVCHGSLLVTPSV